jgi:hypothetical protein
MTQQYLAGELSQLLAQLQAVTTGRASVRKVARLRREAETVPLAALASVVVRALELTDALSWDSLSQGDVTTFANQAAISADLHEFGVCAGLIHECINSL